MMQVYVAVAIRLFVHLRLLHPHKVGVNKEIKSFNEFNAPVTLIQEDVEVISLFVTKCLNISLFQLTGAVRAHLQD